MATVFHLALSVSSCKLSKEASGWRDGEPADEQIPACTNGAVGKGTGTMEVLATPCANQFMDH